LPGNRSRGVSGELAAGRATAGEWAVLPATGTLRTYSRLVRDPRDHVKEARAMFVQVIQGETANGEQLRAALDRWYGDLAPGADGWLGTTAGVTPEGTFLGLARFQSADAARRNSERPAQTEWWMETAKIFAADVAFHDCDDAFTYLRGGSDDAGFVQVMQYRVDNPDRLRELSDRTAPMMSDFRPEIIGGTVAPHGDGRVTEAVYFTSEAAAREGERKEMPAQMKELLDQEAASMHDVTFFDLRQPWLYSPA
jgi:hypothetical protein